MRESNLCFPNQNRAAVCISSALYDRRALDCTATLPLINSLTHLVYLTSTSPRIREILVLDGGLERLVRILSVQNQGADLRNLWKWSLAFQCVVNVGVRGTEQIRTRVVEAGMIPVVLKVLENFLRALEIVRQENERQKQDQQQQRQASNIFTLVSAYTPEGDIVANFHLSAAEPTPGESQVPRVQAPVTAFSPLVNPSSELTQVTSPNYPASTSPSLPTYTTAATATATAEPSIPPQQPLPSLSSLTLPACRSQEGRPSRLRRPAVRRSTFPYARITSESRRRTRSQAYRDPSTPAPHAVSPGSLETPASNIDNIFYREEDILMSLQLLAYLSKYSHIRSLFHTAYEHNVFSVVEKFTHKMHPGGIQYWAGVIMRNACRKDEVRSGTRRCANMHCGKWESQPREFAKCRRCRKAKYCSKACQSQAWNDGHRWWCVERSSVSATAPVRTATAGATATVSHHTHHPQHAMETHPQRQGFQHQAVEALAPQEQSTLARNMIHTETRSDDNLAHRPSPLVDNRHRDSTLSGIRDLAMRVRHNTVVVNEIAAPPDHSRNNNVTLLNQNTEASSTSGESLENHSGLVDVSVGMEL